jgi:hypothetical protein
MWLARRAAEYLLDRTADCLGECAREAVRNWVDLRDLLAERDTVRLSDLLEGIESLKIAMSDRWELFAERLHDLLDPIHLEVAPEPELIRPSGEATALGGHTRT